MNKNILRLLIGGAILTSAASLSITQNDVKAWSTIGGSLDLSQRDMRVYNNFTDSTANDNLTPHPNWPGYTKIEMAGWKAGAEWGARSFGDGSGDSTQANVGDGGANFNFFWSGDASAVGGFNANIMSPIAGSSGGVLAYTETPISDGWRIRFYESWTWDDGPGNVPSSRMDFQGIACHELGHALGLGHSNNSAATMYAYASGNGVADRSIESDDRNGIQVGIYGAMWASMPEITSVTGSLNGGGTAVITGANFTSTGNTVWLNSDVVDSTNAGGDPYKITGLASTAGGTQISFTVPSSGILAGSIHVQKNSTVDAALSEGHPFDYGGGAPGVDVIQLTAPTIAFAGQNAVMDFTNGAANTVTYLLWSFNNTGTVINGHNFDIGTPWNIGATMTSDGAGAGSYTVPIPAGAAGLTVYLEIGQDDNGTILDSNLATMTIQ